MSDEAKVTDIGVKQAEAVLTAEPAVKEREFVRFSLLFRLQHVGMFLGCITLIITGIPLKYADTSWATAYFNMVGGVEVSGIIHRVGAALLILVGVVHMFYTVFLREGRHNFMELLPRVKDVKDVIHNVLYFFGFAKEPPKFARFSYIEKFDYWAVYWGMVVMIGSGLILWFSTRAMALLPKVWMDVAHEAHSDEALLATLAIVVWHFYNVHFSPDHWPANMTWWHGRISESKMKHHHGAEYEKLMAQLEQPISEPAGTDSTEPEPVLPEEPESDERPARAPIAELVEPQPSEEEAK